MRIFLAFFICLWAGNASAMMGLMVGDDGAAAPACASCSEDVASTDGATNTDVTANAVGQSFQVTAASDLCYVDVHMLYVQDNSEIEVRWGTSNNLTTYSASKTLTFTSTDDVQYQRFTFDTKVAVTTGTTYYLGIVKNSGTWVITYRNNSGTYANGALYTGTGWNMTTQNAGQDLNFKVGLCD